MTIAKDAANIILHCDEIFSFKFKDTMRMPEIITCVQPVEKARKINVCQGKKEIKLLFADCNCINRKCKADL